MENGQFQGLKCCFWGQFVTKGYDVDDVMSALVGDVGTLLQSLRMKSNWGRTKPSFISSVEF